MRAPKVRRLRQGFARHRFLCSSSTYAPRGFLVSSSLSACLTNYQKLLHALDCTCDILQVAAMNTKRGSQAMTAVDGQIMAVGGWDSSEFLKSVEAFDARKVCSLVHQGGRLGIRDFIS